MGQQRVASTPVMRLHWWMTCSRRCAATPPELEQQMGRNLERNRDNLQDLGLASQRELDELRGHRLDRLEQQLRQRDRQD